MRGYNILEGQTVLVGDASVMIERIEFNSTKSFIKYKLSEGSSTFEQAIVHAGEMIHLMPLVILAAIRIVRGKETYAVVGIETPHDISILG